MATDGFQLNDYSSAGNNSVDNFVNFAFTDDDATEDPHKGVIPADMTLSNFHVYVTSNSRDVAITGRLRIAGANGNLAVTITASTTGVFSDTSNTDVLSQGDLVNYMWDFAGGSGNVTCRAASLERTA